MLVDIYQRFFSINDSSRQVINGGSGTPGPLVAFPGAYNERDPGILICECYLERCIQ